MNTYYSVDSLLQASPPMSVPYADFIKRKALVYQGGGVAVNGDDINATLFPFQRAIVAWALRKGRCAIFADTGLGKTFMQLEWARLLGKRTLIVAPLGVAKQTEREAQKLFIECKYVRHQGEVGDSFIVITNYEMVEEFDPAKFEAVVLDESSILKSLTGKTRQKLTEMFSETPYRLCCTATPAPNDIAEIANHAAFLGIMTRSDMLASFFVHDENGWRLRGHAAAAFYRWMASWGMALHLPSDIGYEDDGFILPELQIIPHLEQVDYTPEGQLFFVKLAGIGDRSKVRRATQNIKVAALAEMVNQSAEQWLIWCGLNSEADAVDAAIPDSVQVSGSDDIDFKHKAFSDFQDGLIRVLITKSKIGGFGLNFQNCHNVAFIGLSDSWESYYQCIRRCWRFGQTAVVQAHIMLSTPEQGIMDNVMQKERAADTMRQELIANSSVYEREELEGDGHELAIAAKEVTEGNWRMMLGDCVERLAEVESETVGLSVFSPPFQSLFTYSPTAHDIGNSKTSDDFFEHMAYVARELLRVTLPGRNCCVHTADIPAMLERDGYIGMRDFPGAMIRLFESVGWIWHGRVVIDKDPQAQAIRTHSKGLLFAQVHKDSSWSRPAVGDHVVIFRKAGDNKTPIVPDLSNEEWIEWARPIWYGIRESDTLQYMVAREESDDRHICPLQLGTIERCIRLWSNPGELVLSPFAGIGSEGHVAIKLGRRFVGIELKKGYFTWACRNIRAAATQIMQPTIFDVLNVEAEGDYALA